MKLVKFDFDGNEYEADADALNSYTVIKAISKAEKEPAYAFLAFEKVFAGRDEEYAATLGDSATKMAELLVAAVDTIGGEPVKNS